MRETAKEKIQRWKENGVREKDWFKSGFTYGKAISKSLL